MKISFLIHSAYSMGGVPRRTFNLAAALDKSHEVEIVSSERRADRPALRLDHKVKVIDLTDIREGRIDARNPRLEQPSEVYPKCDGFAKLYNRLIDERMAAWFRETDADVVISTRPALGSYVAAHAPSRMLRIAQEHEGLHRSKGELRNVVDAIYATMDAVVCLTDSDAMLHRDHYPPGAPRIFSIPAAVPAADTYIPPEAGRVVISGGRLVSYKRNDVLVDAFAIVAKRHPDWNLRIYGRGPEGRALREQIEELGIHDSVTLVGPAADLQAEWVKGAIAATATDDEPFGMSIVEAMRCGLPVVSADTPAGPREIIEHGVNGLLVERRSPEAMADALIQLIEDPDRRAAMGAAAAASAHRYDPDRIADKYTQLIGELADYRRVNTMQATCRADSMGNLQIILPTGFPDEDSWRVVCQPRATDQKIVTLDLSRASREAGPVAVMERSQLDLSEGRWDFFLEYEGVRQCPLLASRVELAGLLLCPRPTTRLVSWWIPYINAGGQLSLRTWRRNGHAELGDVKLSDTGLTLSISTPTPSDHDELVLVPRSDSRAVAVRTRLQRTRSGVAATIPVADIAAAAATSHDDWDVFLVRAGYPEVRVARLFDDLEQRKRIHTYRSVPVVSARGTTRVRLYFTPANDLSVSASTR
ncbi:glycosyltransferase [Streptomyces sp. BA2]|uniref:glycosyltransferase n=1 Tax=Streptomyces sp. BA2 TaxID=436595 RepID=UPI001371C29B|nr:glycosyltransferase [Streptomyces sp. BA2]